MQGLVLPGLELTYHLGYTHANYNSGELSSNGNSVDLNGKHQVFTPDLTSMFAAQYNYTISKIINVFIRGEWYYFGKQYFDLANQQVQTSYQLLNASAGISVESLSFSLWSRNISGTKYVAYAYDFGAAEVRFSLTVYRWRFAV